MIPSRDDVAIEQTKDLSRSDPRVGDGAGIEANAISVCECQHVRAAHSEHCTGLTGTGELCACAGFTWDGRDQRSARSKPPLKIIYNVGGELVARFYNIQYYDRVQDALALDAALRRIFTDGNQGTTAKHVDATVEKKE